DADGGAADQQALFFRGFGAKDPVVKIVGDRRTNDQQETAGRRESGGQTSGGHEGDDPVGESRHLRGGENDDVTVGAGEARRAQHFPSVAAPRASGVDVKLVFARQSAHFRCAHAARAKDLVSFVGRVANDSVAVV